MSRPNHFRVNGDGDRQGNSVMISDLRRLVHREPGDQAIHWGTHCAAAAALFAMLGGCITVADQATADIEVRRNACRQQTFRSNVERARCHNAAEARLGDILGIDLATVRWQSRLVIAEKTDRKQLTEAEGELEFAKVNADLTSQAARRLQVQQLVDAQHDAAIARRRIQRAAEMQPTTSGSFDCVSRSGLGEIKTECRDSGVLYTRTNPAIQYQ